MRRLLLLHQIVGLTEHPCQPLGKQCDDATLLFAVAINHHVDMAVAVRLAAILAAQRVALLK